MHRDQHINIYKTVVVRDIKYTFIDCICNICLYKKIIHKVFDYIKVSNYVGELISVNTKFIVLVFTQLKIPRRTKIVLNNNRGNTS